MRVRVRPQSNFLDDRKVHIKYLQRFLFRFRSVLTLPN